jgi:alcohol dehydrogenase class IV
MSGIAFSVSLYSTSLAIALAVASFYKIDIELIMNIAISHVMEYNLSSSTGKYVQIAKVMGEDCRDATVIEAAIKAVEGIRKAQSEYGLAQKLSEFKVNKNDFKSIAKIAAAYNLNDNSPKSLNAGEIEAILVSAY